VKVANIVVIPLNGHDSCLLNRILFIEV